MQDLTNYQIGKCDDCGDSYDHFFGGCKCHTSTIECECGQEFTPDKYDSACPYCVKNNDVVEGLFKGDLEPLYLAISRGDVDYYGQKATVDYRVSFGQPAISLLAGGNTEQLRRLLEDGANPNALDREGSHALFSAGDVEGGNIESFKLLISYGANPDVISLKSNWEYYWAGTEEEKEELREFIENSRSGFIKG